jgi:predicted ATPase
MAQEQASKLRKKKKSASHRVDYQVEWVNFRGFQSTGKIVFRPLTILIGPNNVGKTSLIAPFLLLSQTITSRDTVTPLVTRGRLIDAGAFINNVYHQDAEKNIELTLRFHVLLPPPKGAGKVGDYPPGALRVVLGKGEDYNDIVLKEYHIHDIFDRPYIKRIRRTDGSYTLEGISFAGMTEDEKEAIEKSLPTNFLFSPNQLLHRYRLASEGDEDKPNTSPKRSLSKNFSHYLQVAAYSFEEVRSLLTGTTYIGPLRERPRRHYQTDSEVPSSVGPRGERTANLIRRRSKDLAFQKKLDDWVQRFEFGIGVVVDQEVDDIFAISFQRDNPSRKVNLADSGFGASQVLPLIVQALAANEDSVTIAEQPEIHLNPRLQTVLADLLVEMANARQKVIVETHSEHLLLRLRRHIAEGTISSKDVAVYFVEQGKDGSCVREIALENNGHISPEDWPKGFFGETLKESFALATAQAKANQKTRGKAKKDVN